MPKKALLRIGERAGAAGRDNLRQAVFVIVGVGGRLPVDHLQQNRFVSLYAGFIC